MSSASKADIEPSVLQITPSRSRATSSGQNYEPKEKKIKPKKILSSCGIQALALLYMYMFKKQGKIETTYSSTPEQRDPCLSLSQLLIIHIGAAMTLFLATTDATIVSTSLPTIVADLKGSQSQYAWVGIAYLLTQTAFQPLFGRFSDFLGRKNILYFSLIIFMIGSLLCGLATSMSWLCIFRALSGIGGGGIVNSVWLITSEIVDESRRAKWSQALSVTWSASAVAGPLLGGLFSGANNQHVNWRWAFLMNLPIGFSAFVLLIVSLRNINFTPTIKTSWREQLRKFDFLGLISFMGGTVGVILGLSFSSVAGWTAFSTLMPLVIGCAILIFGVFYELRTQRDPLFPPLIFRNTTVGIILLISFLHNFAFNAGTYYLSLYYQAVDGSSALEAGLKMLPYSLGSALASIPAALFIGCQQININHAIRQKVVIGLGLAISTVGFGLQILLNQYSSILAQEIYPLISGIGIGLLFHAPYQILTRVADPGDLASVTGAFFLVRFTGATTGLSVAAVIFDSHIISSRIGKDMFTGSNGSIGLLGWSLAQPVALTGDLIQLYSDAIKLIWIVCTPCIGFCFVMSFFIKICPTFEKSYTCDLSNPVLTDAKSASLMRLPSNSHVVPSMNAHRACAPGSY